MSIVKDMSLAPSGHQKIQWVRDFMPALSGIEERFRREKPFEGLTIAVSVHLEAKTANLGLVLREGGAQALVIKFLMNFIKKHDFKVFGWYRIVLGILVVLIKS